MSLALPALDDETATQLAESEGLVTHLTSLVLVDEVGAAQEGIPGTRKIALPMPRTASAVDEMASRGVEPLMMERIDRFAGASPSTFKIDAFLEEPMGPESSLGLPIAFRRLVKLIEDFPSRLEPNRAGTLLK